MDEAAGPGGTVRGDEHPTLLVFEQGKLVRQAVGARPKAGVLELLG